MEEKLNWKAIDSYSLSFSGKLVESFFSGKPKISGKEILKLSPVKQVNLFVLDELLRAWKEESEKLKSPYFDYDALEVKESYQHFLNELSNNILIDRGHFAPLLKVATSNTLLLVFAPYDFFSSYIKEQPEIVLDTLLERLKYIRVNKAPLQGLADEMQRRSIKKLSGQEAFRILDHVIQELSFSPADFEEFTSQFSLVSPLDPDKFYTTFDAPKAEVVKTAPVNNPKQEKNAPTKLFEQIEKETLADNFQRAKISKIRDNLNINQRFMFINVLFKGNTDKFNSSIEFIDSCADRSVAFRFIAESQPDWDKESEAYIEFMELVEKRFI